MLGSALFTHDLEAAREAAHLVLVRSPSPHAWVRLGSPPQGAYVIVAEDVPDLIWPHQLPDPPPKRATSFELARERDVKT